MKNYLILLLVLLGSVNLKAQKDLFGTIKTYTYIYKLSNKDLENIVKKENTTNEDFSFDFDNLLKNRQATDSFLTEKINYQTILDEGTYLFMKIQDNSIKYDFHIVNSFELNIITDVKNYKNLLLHLTNKDLKAIEDAEVWVDGKKIKFDLKKQAYFLKNSYYKNILIKYKGNDFYYNSDSNINYLYSPKPKYTKNLKKYLEEEKISFNGYIITNKPKYFPKDTVKLKVWLINETTEKPYNDSIDLYLDKEKIAKIAPYKAGNYEYSFLLDDSLKLRLDDRYVVEIRVSKNKNKDEEYDFEDEEEFYNRNLKTHIIYEEYQLNENKYTFELPENKQVFYENEKINLILEGKDSNDFNILDAKAKITVYNNANSVEAKQSIFVPNILWEYSLPLEKIGKKKVILPDSVFPKVNFDFTVKVLFSNSNNENKELEKTLRYSVNPKKEEKKEEDFAKFQLINNRLKIVSTLPNDKKKYLLKKRKGYERDSIKKITLPYEENISFFTKFTLENELQKVVRYDLSNEYERVLISAESSQEETNFTLKNPNNLPCWYVIYQNKKMIQEGYTKQDWNYKIKNKNLNDDYFFYADYIYLGEKQKSFTYSNYQKKPLNIKVTQEEKIYPGKKTKIDIEVKNSKGEPSANTDLLAYALTKKFEEYIIYPRVPTINKQRDLFLDLQMEKDRENSVVYSHLRISKEYQSFLTPEKAKKFGLDSLLFYQVYYGENNKGLKKTYLSNNTKDIAEVQVVVFRKLGINTIYWIAIDDKIKYLGLNNNALASYDFQGEEKKCEIIVRLANKKIIFKDVVLKKGKKVVVSLNVDYFEKDENVKIVAEKNTWQEEEKQKIINSMIHWSIEPKLNNAYVSVQQGNEVLSNQFYQNIGFLNGKEKLYFHYKSLEKDTIIKIDFSPKTLYVLK